MDSNGITRRSFIKQGSASAAAAGAFIAVPKSIARLDSKRPRPSTAKAATATTKGRATADRQIVVHIPDSSESELRVMSGERETVIRDRDLVARLVRASH